MPRWQAPEMGTTRDESGRVRAPVDFPPGGAGRWTRVGQRRLTQSPRGYATACDSAVLPRHHADMHGFGFGIEADGRAIERRDRPDVRHLIAQP